MRQLEKIAKHIPGVVYQFRRWPDGQSAFPYASPGIEKIYGLLPEDVQRDASKVFERIHPDDLPAVAESIDQSEATLSDWHHIYRAYLPEKGWIWLEGEASPERLDDGSTLWHGYIRDITARTEHEMLQRQARSRFEAFVANTPVAMAMFDTEMNCIAASNRWGELLGVPVHLQIGKNHYEVFPDLPEAWREAHQKGLRGENVEDEKSRWDRDDGSYVWYHWVLRPWYDSESSRQGIIISFRDITARVEMEAEIERNHQEITALLDNSALSYISLDHNKCISNINRAAETLLKIERKALIGASFDTAQPALAEQLNAALSAALTTGSFQLIEAQLLPSSDWVQVSLVPWSQGLWVVIEDITDRKQSEATMEMLATTDPLTGAFNRSKGQALLEAESSRLARYGTPISVIMIDIDFFKQVNDQYGHDVGDQVLKTLVSRIQRTLRKPDSMIRWGGEEFLVILPSTDLMAATEIAKRYLAVINQTPFDEVGVVTISMGVAELRPAEAVHDFLRRADEHLYAAKRNGRDQVVAMRDSAA
ncbi:MAG: sensor domain-containing diguanylate cyclase [Halieaceae bacterium]|nr:sensor domain-containing diguanylate cyclase [Halieaceae bacterium]